MAMGSRSRNSMSAIRTWAWKVAEVSLIVTKDQRYIPRVTNSISHWLNQLVALATLLALTLFLPWEALLPLLGCRRVFPV